MIISWALMFLFMYIKVGAKTVQFDGSGIDEVRDNTTRSQTHEFLVSLDYLDLPFSGMHEI
jgi:hypothetical protein